MIVGGAPTLLGPITSGPVGWRVTALHATGSHWPTTDTIDVVSGAYQSPSTYSGMTPMSETAPANGLADDIELRRTPDGWVWVDTAEAGPDDRVVESVDAVEYAVVPREIRGVDHLRIAELDREDDEAEPSPDRWVCSSHWYDLDGMR